MPSFSCQLAIAFDEWESDRLALAAQLFQNLQRETHSRVPCAFFLSAFAQEIEHCKVHWQKTRGEVTLAPLRSPRAGAGQPHSGTAAARWDEMEAGERSWRRSLGHRLGAGWLQWALFSAERFAAALPPWARRAWVAANCASGLLVFWVFVTFGPGRGPFRAVMRRARVSPVGRLLRGAWLRLRALLGWKEKAPRGKAASSSEHGKGGGTAVAGAGRSSKQPKRPAPITTVPAVSPGGAAGASWAGAEGADDPAAMRSRDE